MAAALRDKSSTWKWIATAVLLFAGALLLARLIVRAPASERLAQTVTIRYEDTGEETKINRGMFEKILLEQAVLKPLDPSKGLVNPKTNTQTGFPIDRELWNRLIKEINAAVAEHNQVQSQSGATP